MTDNDTTAQPHGPEQNKPSGPTENQNSGSNLPDPNPQRLDEAKLPRDLGKRRK